MKTETIYLDPSDVFFYDTTNLEELRKWLRGNTRISVRRDRKRWFVRDGEAIDSLSETEFNDYYAIRTAE